MAAASVLIPLIMDVTRTDGLLAAIRESVPASRPCVTISHLALLETVFVLGDLIMDAGLTPMVVLPAAANLVDLTLTVLSQKT
mmetsp:Transcript_18195/g.36546  ORF Transcript_18195/g.36546 Transcript_18195/m.36546 type:complete len:83 (+) Transcript_18195:1024-1272(+)